MHKTLLFCIENRINDRKNRKIERFSYILFRCMRIIYTFAITNYTKTNNL